MMLLPLMSLAFSTMAPPNSAARAGLRVVADSDSVLTVDVLAKMTTFWTTFLKEPDSIRTTGSNATQKQLQLHISGQGEELPPFTVVDMNAMAAKYPSVVRDLQQAHLTVQQWEAYRIALFDALTVQRIQRLSSAIRQLDPQVGLTSNMLQVPAESEKNGAFLDAHQKEVSALQATGMLLPVPVVSMDGQQVRLDSL